MPSGSRTSAITWVRPPQWSQVSRSMANVRRSSSTKGRYRERWVAGGSAGPAAGIRRPPGTRRAEVSTMQYRGVGPSARGRRRAGVRNTGRPPAYRTRPDGFTATAARAVAEDRVGTRSPTSSGSQTAVGHVSGGGPELAADALLLEDLAHDELGKRDRLAEERCVARAGRRDDGSPPARRAVRARPGARGASDGHLADADAASDLAVGAAVGLEPRRQFGAWDR